MIFILGFTTLIGLLLTVATIIGVTRYDMLEIKKLRHLKIHPYARQYRLRPLVTIVVIAGPNKQLLLDCLESIANLTYRKVEVIVIQPLAIIRGSTSRKQSGYRFNLRAYQTKRPLTTAIPAAYKRYGHGELVAIIECATDFDPSSIGNAVRTLLANDRPASAVSFSQHIRVGMKASSVMIRYDNLATHLALKTKSALSLLRVNEPFNILFRQDALQQMMQPGQCSAYFAQSAIVHQAPADTLLAPLTQRFRMQLQKVKHTTAIVSSLRDNRSFENWHQVIQPLILGAAAVLLPVLLIYFFYLALVLHQPTLLLISWVILIAILVFSVWSSSSLSLQQKMLLGVFSPAAYLVFFIMSFMQIAVLLQILATAVRTIRLRGS